MARFSSGARAAGAGSTTLPIGSLYGGSTGGGRIREIGVTNTTATSVAVHLIRLTNTGTQGSGLTEAKHDLSSGPALCTAFNTHTVDPTSGGIDLGYRTILGAAIGAAWVWTFGDSGLVIPADTTEGVGIITSTGTGQVLDFYFVWDE
jgi:hypothetical protein